MLWYGHCDCIVDVDGIVGPSALALWLLYIYIGLAVPANNLHVHCLPSRHDGPLRSNEVQ